MPLADDEIAPVYSVLIGAVSKAGVWQCLQDWPHFYFMKMLVLQFCFYTPMCHYVP